MIMQDLSAFVEKWSKIWVHGAVTPRVRCVSKCRDTLEFGNIEPEGWPEEDLSILRGVKMEQLVCTDWRVVWLYTRYEK